MVHIVLGAWLAVYGRVKEGRKRRQQWSDAFGAGGSKVCDVTVGEHDDEMRGIEFGRGCETVRGCDFNSATTVSEIYLSVFPFCVFFADRVYQTGAMQSGFVQISSRMHGRTIKSAVKHAIAHLFSSDLFHVVLLRAEFTSSSCVVLLLLVVV